MFSFYPFVGLHIFHFFGKAFEHYILMELLAHRSYSELDYSIEFWCTKSGSEVDFVVESGEIAIEVKGSSRVDKNELKLILIFDKEFACRKLIVVCNEKDPRKVGDVEILPWRDFLSLLWNNDLIR